MEKANKILVPIDFSSCSENALAYAIQFAAKSKSAIHVLNITTADIDDTENPYMVEMLVLEKINTVRQSLNKYVTAVKKKVSLLLEEIHSFFEPYPD